MINLLSKFTDFITHPAFIWTVSIILGSGLIFWIASYILASYIVYTKTLRRKSADQWSRDVPSSLEPDAVKMYEDGIAWSDKNIQHKHDVHIVNEGLNLYGEYYDFGYKRCAVIISGRTEALKYGYYFAIPYSANGCNVLVLDPRGHGKSDGNFNTVGFEESKDLIAWVNYIKDTFNIKSFVFHGICIGAGGGIFAITNENCPKVIDAFITEGMFPNFMESMKNHLIEYKKPVFIMKDLIDAWMIHYTGHSMKFGPIDVIDKLNVPLLMLHSKEDLYSTPEYAQKLFDKAATEHKKLTWFDHGKHSMLRITATEKYDAEIAAFLKTLPDVNE